MSPHKLVDWGFRHGAGSADRVKRALRDGTHHERRLGGELLQPSPQRLDPIDRDQAAQRLDCEIGVTAGSDRLTQRRRGVATASDPEDPRRHHRTVAIGMTQRPHQSLVMREPGRALDGAATVDAGTAGMRIESVAVKTPVHKSILAHQHCGA
jgi:hypothetical protein